MDRDNMTRAFAPNYNIIATAAAHAHTGARMAANRRGPIMFLAHADRGSAAVRLGACRHSGPLGASAGRLGAAARIPRGGAGGPALLATGIILGRPTILA